MFTLSLPAWLAAARAKSFTPSRTTTRARRTLTELATLDPARLPAFVQESEVALKYIRLLGRLDWTHFPEPAARYFAPDCPALPYAAFVAAYLVKLDQHLTYMSDWRTYLCEHPALVWALGFPLRPDPTTPGGFDVAHSLPTQQHFSRLLYELPMTSLQFLLDETIRQISTLLSVVAPGWDNCISLDTKHIVAWVKENNPKAYLQGKRYDKTQPPKGDPDCRLGCKRKHNRTTKVDSVEAWPTPRENPVSAAHLEIGEYYWGYGSGVVAVKVDDWGEFVLAELTQPFDQPDVSYFYPLMHEVERRLGHRPPYGAFDAAFDAFYVYEYFDDAHGFAAVPFVARGRQSRRTFSPEGHPLCAAGLPMTPRFTFQMRKTLIPHQRTRYACPLRYPEATGEACPIHHANWPQPGCTTTLASSHGARVRYQLDRTTTTYHEVYRQRTATERINSQAVALGIERPKLRNGTSIAHQNTLIYVLINLHALERLHLHYAQREQVESAAQSVHG